MKNNLKITCSPNNDYVSVSNRLRVTLESELDRLFDQQVFEKYKDQKLMNLTQLKKDKQLIRFIFEFQTMNFTLKGKLLSGISNWFHMNDYDRQHIISKFRDLYYRSLPSVDLIPVKIFNIIFCKFLINELLAVLSDSGRQLSFSTHSLN